MYKDQWHDKTMYLDYIMICMLWKRMTSWVLDVAKKNFFQC